MKEKLEFLVLVFLLFMFPSNCWDIEDCRFVKNQTILDAVRKQIDCSDTKAKFCLNEKYIGYNSSVFIIVKKI